MKTIKTLFAVAAVSLLAVTNAHALSPLMGVEPYMPAGVRLCASSIHPYGLIVCFRSPCGIDPRVDFHSDPRSDPRCARDLF